MGAYKIDADLAPDVLHLSKRGLEVMLTECLDPAISMEW